MTRAQSLMLLFISKSIAICNSLCHKIIEIVYSVFTIAIPKSRIQSGSSRPGKIIQQDNLNRRRKYYIPNAYKRVESLDLLRRWSTKHFNIEIQLSPFRSNTYGKCNIYSSEISWLHPQKTHRCGLLNPRWSLCVLINNQTPKYMKNHRIQFAPMD